MAKKLILISHGRFCEELKRSVEMIMGPQEDILAVPLLEEEGPEDFRQKFLQVSQGLDSYLVFADLLGGTPCNVVSRLILEGQDIELYTGMNMPMVIGYLNDVLTGTATDFPSRASQYIVNVRQHLQACLDDDD